MPPPGASDIEPDQLRSEGRQGFDPDVQPHWEVTPHVFSGTLVVRGQGVVQVGRTGARTALGHIGSSLAAIAVTYDLLRHDWVDGFLYGVTVDISG